MHTTLRSATSAAKRNKDKKQEKDRKGREGSWRRKNGRGGERRGEKGGGEGNEKDLEPSSLSKQFSSSHWASGYIALKTGPCARLEKQCGAPREVTILVGHQQLGL